VGRGRRSRVGEAEELVRRLVDETILRGCGGGARGERTRAETRRRRRGGRRRQTRLAGEGERWREGDTSAQHVSERGVKAVDAHADDRDLPEAETNLCDRLPELRCGPGTP